MSQLRARWRRLPRIVVRLFVVAAVVRLLYVAAGFEVPPQDTPDYDEIAANLLAGAGFVAHDNWFGHPMRSWRAPAYPVFLAGVYGVFGPGNHLAARVAQALIGAGTVVLVYLLAARLNPAAAPLAGWATALYAPLVAGVNEVMTETLFTALLVAALWSALEARARGGWRWALATGVLVGLAGLTRPVGLLIGPAVIAVALWETRADGAERRRALRFAGAVGAGLLVTLLPWTARNAVVHQAFVPVSTHGGFIVAHSNADAPDWRRADGWGIEAAVFERIPSEVERDRFWMRQGLAWIGDHPLTYARLAGERFLRFWYVFQPGYNVCFALLAPFALAGLAGWGAAPGFRYASAVCALSTAVFCLVLYGSTRFRLPLEPIFLIYGATSAVAAWQRWGRRFAAVAGVWAGLQGLVWWQQTAAREAVVQLLRSAGLK